MRKKYDISNSSKINFISADLGNGKIEYAPYNEEKGFLDMSYCKGVKIKQIIDLKNETNLDLSAISKYMSKGIDSLNVNDPFFNEICYSYSEYGNDIILGDRRKDIYQNFSGCNKGCQYDSLTEDLQVICNCEIVDNFTIDMNSTNYDEFEDISLFDSNIGVVKCYKLVFSFDGKLTNIGFWIFSILLIANIIILVFYFHSGLKSIIEYLFNEMVNYGYLDKNHKIFFNIKNNLSNHKEKNKKRRKKIKNINISNPIKRKIKTKNKTMIENTSINNENINLNINHEKSGSISPIKLNKKELLNKIPNKKKMKRKIKILRIFQLEI